MLCPPYIHSVIYSHMHVLFPLCLNGSFSCILCSTYVKRIQNLNQSLVNVPLSMQMGLSGVTWTFFLYKFCSRAKWLTFFKSGNMTWTLTAEVTAISWRPLSSNPIEIYMSAWGPVCETVLSVKLQAIALNVDQFVKIEWQKISFEKCIYMLSIAVLPQALIGESKFHIRKRSHSSDLHSSFLSEV